MENSGVIAGMSGSPVYIDGRLIGAVAFTWPYAKEPLCGITPIEQMIREKQNIDVNNGNSVSARDDQLKSINTPLFINGFSGETREYIKKIFENNIEGASYMVMNGGGGGNEISPGSGLKAGDAVAINLMEGDYSAQGIGTVTYVSNNDVYIFGHPMDLAGNTALPISKSYIYSVIPSMEISFKMGSSSKPIGAIVYDGKNGVYCQLQKTASMIPVDLKIINNQTEYNYTFNAVDNRNYFPALTSGAISSSILNHTGNLDDKRINMNLIINLEYQNKDYKVINKFNYAFNPSYFNLYGLLSDLNQYFSVFYQNNIGNIKIKDIHIDISIEKGIKYYTLEGFSVDKTIYKPGETVQCKLLLKEYLGNYTTKTIGISIPYDCKNGQYALIAGSEMSFYAELIKTFPKYFSINNMDDLIKIANFKEDSSLLTIGLILGRQGLIFNDLKMERFPEAYMNYFLQSSDKSNQLFSPDLVMGNKSLDEAVFGSMKAVITVMEKQTQALE